METFLTLPVLFPRKVARTGMVVGGPASNFFSVREDPIGYSLLFWPAPLKDSRGSHCQGCSTCPYYRKGDGPEAAGLDEVWEDWRDADVMRRRPGGPHDALIAIQISVTLGGSVVTGENAALLLKSRVK